MEEDPGCFNMGFLSVFVAVALIIFALIVGIKILSKMIPVLIRASRTLSSRQNPAVLNLHREVGELRRATLQISQNWEEMTTLINSIKSQQGSFVRRLDSDFDALGDSLQISVKVTLEEECLRNDQRFEEINRMVEGFREDFHVLTEIIQKQGEMLRKDLKKKSRKVVDGWSQTEREMFMRKRPRDGHGKALVGLGGENERSSTSVIKKALGEFLKEAKEHLTLEREEVMSNLRSMFVQLSEDRKEIKTTIESAFSVATHQTRRSIEQFGDVGHDAMKCISVLNEKSQTLLTTRFQESGEKINSIFVLLKGLDFDVKSIKATLDNIDGQFDDIYQRVELGCQKNIENAEEIVDNLQKTAEKWDEKALHLNSMGKQIADAAVNIRETLNSLNKSIRDNAGAQLKLDSQIAPNMTGDLLDESFLLSNSITIFRRSSSSEGFDLLPAMMQTCFGKLNSLKDQIETGTGGIKESVDVLLQKLHCLTELVENSVDSLKNLNVQIPFRGRHQSHENFKTELREFVGDILSLDSNAEASSAGKFHIPLEGNASESKTNLPSDVPKPLVKCEANLQPSTRRDIRGKSGNSNFSRATNNAKKISIATVDETPNVKKYELLKLKKRRGHK